MAGRFWPLVGVLFGVLGCSGPAAVREPLSGRSDAGGATGSDAGTTPLPEGPTLLASSGVALGGYLDNDWDASVNGVDGAEAGLPQRIGGDAAWTNAAPAGMPQVVNNGGPTLRSPVFQAVTFANYDLTASVDDFVSHVGLTSYWVSAVSEYGVGLARAANPVHLTAGAPQNIDDTQIQAWLAEQLTGGSALDPPASGTVYVLFYPFSTSVTLDGQESCFTMGAYHNSIVVGGADVVYAVIPECTTDTMTEEQTTTAAASHEMIETATDPLPLTATPAYSGVDTGHLYFPMVLGGSEVADLCAQWPSSYFVADSLPYTVQRTWSNAAAAAGRDPCQPELDGETFFNAVPTLTDTVHAGTATPPVTTLGIAIAPGTSKVVDVVLYSEADVGPWTVSAVSVPVGEGNLSFSWDKTTGNNGDTLHLTITANYADEGYGGEPFHIESKLGGETNYWLGYVGQ